MDYRKLGKTGLSVSHICFGALTLSPLQKNLKLEDGARLLKSAYESGINFFDTADLYQNYQYFKTAFNKNDDVIIATKSYAFDKKTADESLEKARKRLNRENIDIFLLHEQESELTLKGHREAIDFFLEKKQKGIIKAFGISTHYISGVKAANKLNEIDVIHPIVNLNGIGIVDGTLDEMIKELTISKSLGKGVYSMKPLGGGHLINRAKEAFDFVMDLDCVDSVAIGMQSDAELKYNLSVFNNIIIDEKIKTALENQKRHLFIHHDWCVMCEACVKRCNVSALKVKNNRIEIDEDKCVLCSYCSTVCKELAIKII